MAYLSELLLLAGTRRDRRKEALEEIANPPYYKAKWLRTFISMLGMTDNGTFQFKNNGHPFKTGYCEDDEGLVEAIEAPWGDFEEIASWVAGYADAGSKIHIHSLEADGNDFAYEFDGKGKMRFLAMQPSSGWLDPHILKPGVLPKPSIKSRKKKK